MKSSKKALAFALAAAMAITGVPVTNAGAATTTAKLGATKATIYAGNSKYISVSTPSSWKSVKLSVSSSKTSVASVKKNNAKKKIRVDAVKAGTAKVTVKVTAKKSGKTVKKTLSANITVKDYKVRLVDAAGTTVSNTTIDTTVGTAVKLTAKTAPANDKVTFTSDNESVATVDASGNVTPVKAGTVTITAASAKASDKVTINVSEAAKEGLSVAVSNELSKDYPDTVMVNKNAIVKVTLVKNGKPVQGESVVISLDYDNSVGNTSPYNYLASYKINGNQTAAAATTDANGVASFAIGTTDSGVKASYTNYVASIKYTVQSSSATTEGTVNFAAVSNKAITNVNNHNTITTDNLKPGTNYQDAIGGDGLANTYSMDNITSVSNVEYVESQQVSSTGTKEHEVTMEGGYPVITVPGSSTIETVAEKRTEAIDPAVGTSGKYNVYESKSVYIPVKEDPNKLTYATLNFSNVTLSKYTRLKVETYQNEEAAKKGDTSKRIEAPTYYDGEMVQDSVNYQIPLKGGYAGMCVKATVEAKGQVDQAKNAGFVAKEVVYVYKKQTSTTGNTYPLQNATVDWKIVSTPYTAEEEIDPSSVVGVPVTAGEKLKAKVPAFPYTGTAVITKYDKNGKVVGYYAAATQNDRTPGKLNTNIIPAGTKVYQISSDELRDSVGEITGSTGSTVTVNAYQSGRTTLEGTVKVDGKVLDDAELANVYTSIQWNPVPKTTETTNSEAFVALLGQKIEVVAQLTDKNGNAVSEAGHGIAFKVSGNKVNTTDTSVSSVTTDGKNGKNSATVVNTLTNSTDANGQTKMILKASKLVELLNITADSADSKYDAKLIIAGKDVTQADLYWIDADLAFTDKVKDGVTVQTTTDKPAEEVKGSNISIEPEAGTKWMYGVFTLGTAATYGALAGKTININGLKVTMSKTSSSVGSFETCDVPGAVIATSTKGGEMDIVSKIDSSTLTTGVTTSVGTFAGTGATSISKKLTIPVTWQAQGLTASYIAPTGTRVQNDSTSGTAVYLKVTDIYDNAVPDNDVTFKVDDGNIIGDSSKVKTVKTDKNGIATISVSQKGSATTTTVSATITGNTTDTFDETFVWTTPTALAINNDEDPVNGGYLTNYDKDKKTITLTFKDDVVESSVVKELFTVTYKAYDGVDDSGVVKTKDNQLVVKNVVVNDNVVTLTLSDVPSLVDARDTVEVDLSKDVPVKSVKYTLTSTSGALYNKTVVISLDGKTEPKEK